jgi:hypothetical protein
VKVIAVLKDSTDYVVWVNEWLEKSFMEIGIRPLQIYITEIPEFDTLPIPLFNTMIHIVNWDGEYGRISSA